MAFTKFTNLDPLTGDQLNDRFPRGFMGETRRIASNPTFTTTETVLDVLTFTAEAGRRYEVTWMATYQSSVANDLPRFRFRYQAGASLTTGGTEFSSSMPNCDVASRGQPIVMTDTVAPGVTGQLSIGSTGIRNNGTGTVTMNGSSAQPAVIRVVDVGPA